MSTRILRREVITIDAVGASKTGLITLPIGERFHKIQIFHGYSAGVNDLASGVANIKEIRLKINDKVERIFTGKELRDALLLHGTQYDFKGTPNDGMGVSIPIYFTEPWRKDNKDGLALALPTRWNVKDGPSGQAFKSLKIEIDFGAATAPKIQVFTFTDEVVPTITTPAPILAKFARITVNAAAQKYAYTSLVKRHNLGQLTVYPDTGGSRKPTQVTFTVGSDDRHKLPYEANYVDLLENDMFPLAAGRTADLYDMVLDVNDLLFGAEPLETDKSLQLVVEAAAVMSGTSTFIAQLYGMPESY